MYVWLRFPVGFNAGPSGPLVANALSQGVLYIPGEFGHVNDATGHKPRNEVRLSFGVAEPAQLAEGIKRDLDDRLTELEAIAADDDVRQAVVDFSSKPREERQPLWDLLNDFKKRNDRRWSGLGRSLDDSWFLQDVEGHQRWRDVISMSLDGNYNYRDYFHGGGFHYTEGEVPVGVVPIRKRYVCVPYRGTTTRQYLIALSVPVFAISCMPRQMPRNGTVPRAIDSRMAVSSPQAERLRIAAPNAPTPGSTMRSARDKTRGSRVFSTREPHSSRARAIESMLQSP